MVLNAHITSLNIIPTLQNKDSLGINERTDNFKVLNLRTDEFDTTNVKHHIIITCDRSGSMENGSSGETKINQTKHTIINIFRWAMENNYDIHFTLVIFDNVVDILFENVVVTRDNIVDLTSIINVDVFARNSTDIGASFNTVRKIKEKYSAEDVKMSHIFMTDGVPTYGVVNRDDLVELLPEIETQYFIGFGVDHDPVLLSKFAEKFTNSYYFVDCMENTGNVYGEILHNIVNNLLSSIEIESSIYQMYDSVNNTWVNKLCIKNISVDSQKNIHLKCSWGDIYNLHEKNRTEQLLSISYKMNKFVGNNTDSIVVNSNICSYNYVYKFLWKQKVLELLYKFKHSPLKYSRDEIKTLIDDMRVYIEEKNLGTDEFMKVLQDDLYIAYKTCHKAEAKIFISSRHESSSNERAVMVKNINTRSMSQPIFITRSFNQPAEMKDEEDEEDDEFDDYEILQDMNSLNLNRQQTRISRTVSAPNNI